MNPTLSTAWDRWFTEEGINIRRIGLNLKYHEDYRRVIYLRSGPGDTKRSGRASVGE